jgi:hypothetical protein
MAATDLLVREGGPPDGCEILLHRAPFGHDDLCSGDLLCLSRPYQSSSTQAPDLGRHYGTGGGGNCPLAFPDRSQRECRIWVFLHLPDPAGRLRLVVHPKNSCATLRAGAFLIVNR